MTSEILQLQILLKVRMKKMMRVAMGRKRKEAGNQKKIKVKVYRFLKLEV